MNRTGLFFALGIAVVAGLVFSLYPDVDLAVSRHFYLYADAGNVAFPWGRYLPLIRLREVGLWISTVLVVSAVAALVIKVFLPRRKMLMSGRAALFLIATVVVAPGLLINVVLKEHWGRPRPIDVTQFGGNEHFVAWWDPRGDCPKNCSFVSGDVAGVAWILAPAALAPPQWRVAAYGAALALTAGMSAIRIMAGGHFISDTIFAGVFTFLIVWLAHALIYRWPRTRFTDKAIEHGIERMARPGYDFVVGLFGRRKTKSRMPRAGRNKIAGCKARR